MHEFVLWIFRSIKSFLYFLRLVCVFCILMLVLYWIQNLTHAHWDWISFIIPFLNWLLDIANSIYSVTFDFFGAVFELKYFSALVILTITAYGTKLLSFGVDILEGIYKSAHFVCKKTKEKVFNQNLHNAILKEEKKISKYVVVIHTQIKKKFMHSVNINVDEQNDIMNKFIMQKSGNNPINYEGGFLYQFNDFDKIDVVLDIIFRLLNSSAPLDYSVVIQVGEEEAQLKKLINLKFFGKVAMASDTAYRYKFNETHRYTTSQVGLFQNDGKTLEVHEFKEIL